MTTDIQLYHGERLHHLRNITIENHIRYASAVPPPQPWFFQPSPHLTHTGSLPEYNESVEERSFERRQCWGWPGDRNCRARTYPQAAGTAPVAAGTCSMKLVD